MEIRVITELSKVFPISKVVYELVKSDVDLTSDRKRARSGKGFSPVMVGQNYCVEQLKSIAPVKTVYGWQNNNNGISQIRKHLGLEKIKDKKTQVPESHAVEAIRLLLKKPEKPTSDGLVILLILKPKRSAFTTRIGNESGNFPLRKLN